ncbi:MAG: phenylalanine--tRNA ligase subunit beta [Candidatus Saccharicenans sp.]|nr:phenylalanine--tRNA ligase subunit beta [Candidatus Saccharicenans sp.]MDI6848184.1 phenylalanine--tRNA ligase subunit beta [Candidatus Saccharicenans sp.]
MKISYAWLKEYVNLNLNPEELADCLNQIGLMVETLTRFEDDTVFEIETYANRPDTLGHLGVAREIATLLGLSLKTRNWPLRELPQTTAEMVDINILDPQLCPRYCGLVVKGVKVGPSPDWLKKRLEAVGLRPINNVVDISNYVCFSLGQPIHTFDLSKIKGARIIIRKARKGEAIRTLEGETAELDPEMLVIADETTPVAIAGVIGGEESGITETTTDVFIESANFNPVSIRLTAKKLGLSTDASYRFERGVDPNAAPAAAVMAASLLCEFGGRVSRGLLDVHPAPRKPRTVNLRLRRVNELLGLEIEPDFVVKTLSGLGLKLKEQGPLVWTAEIPGFRVDLEREADLVEEVARFFGYDRIPSAVTPVKSFDLPADRKRDRVWRLKEVLFHHGFDEVINFSFADPEKEQLWQTGCRPIKLQNPISSKLSILRTSLLPGLVENAVWNFNREAEGVHIFEVGNIYYWEEEEVHRENLNLGILTTGLRSGRTWREAEKETDFFVLKGAVEDICGYLGYEQLSFEPVEHPFFEPGQALKILVKNELVGLLGLLNASLARGYDLERPAYCAEISLQELLSRQPRPFSFQPVPRYPGTSRDLSFLVDDSLTYQQIQQQLQKLNIACLENFLIYDRFQGKSLAPGKVSFSVRFYFRHSARTLQTEEVDRAMREIISQLKSTLKIQLR